MFGKKQFFEQGSAQAEGPHETFQGSATEAVHRQRTSASHQSGHSAWLGTYLEDYEN